MFKFSPTKFFVYCALIFGIILITLIPPFQSPDEDSHFKRAYVLSRGHLYPTTQNGIVGYYLPDDMSGYIGAKLTYIGNRDQKYSFSEEILDDRLPKDYSNKSFQNFSTAEVTPIAYVAPALGIVFAKISTAIIGLENISVTVMLHFARFFSLLLYIVLVYTAIKITPVLKKTFCMIGLIPMSLALAVAISYDSVLIACSLLCTAIIFKLIFDDNVRKVSYKYLIALGVIGFILLTIKTVYLTVLFPLIFVPKEKFGENKKNRIKTVSIIAGIAVGIYVLNKIPSLFLSRASSESNSAEQIKLIIQNPINYLKIWILTMWNGRNYYYSGMLGIFGLSDTYLPSIYTIMYTLGFAGVAIADLSICSKKFDWKYKLVAIIGSIASVFAIFFAMYIFWTSMELGIGASTITGVQGRYFIPLIPLGIIIFSNSFMVKSKKMREVLEKILDNSYLVSFIILTVSSISILLRYWC